ncbi:hypothetical protein EV702DRAFT_1127228 [Suillus placidus]|uniref:Uncharacterized protein n=1 Tax=Suillus placidus TaxID=48579 RepID=A0A9P6ZP29_9AGAM|nr:hypothetical protein EV702DRAFT_1127228 [Suillus placidus]
MATPSLQESGGMDTIVKKLHPPTCRPYDPSLPHQLDAITSLLATGGSDGGVIIFSLQSFSALQRLAAHDASVTILQFDANFLITGGWKVFETKSGEYVRDLSERCKGVWKVGGHVRLEFRSFC